MPKPHLETDLAPVLFFKLPSAGTAEFLFRTEAAALISCLQAEDFNIKTKTSFGFWGFTLVCFHVHLGVEML